MSTRDIPVPDAEPVDDESKELPAGEPQTATDKLIAKTPWWSISTGIHVVLALIFAYVIVLARPISEEEAVVVSPPRRPRPVPEMERPKDMNQHEKILDIKKAVEDPVYRKNAEEAERNETNDNEEFEKAKGDSFDFVSDKPFKGKGTYDTIGGGGGGGGRYGGRLGGKRDLVARGGGGSDTEDAVLAALKWLARHQNPDGAWGVNGHTGRCGAVNPSRFTGRCSPNQGEEDYDAGVTGLAILAFLGAGYSHLSKDTFPELPGICFGDVVRRGMQWMMAHQDTEGCIGPRTAHRYMYNHLICALAISEAFGLTGSNLFKDQAQRAVDFTIASQNAGKGWRYSYKSGDNDSSVTGWAAMVLKSADISGLAVPRTAFDGCRSWFDDVTEGNYYAVGYTALNQGKVYEPGRNEHFNGNPALTAIGVMSRIFIDRQKSDPRLSGGCALIVKNLPRWETNDIDFYYWYYASLALFQFDGPSGTYWKQWNDKMKDALVKHQATKSDGCRTGSWDPIDRWGHAGGRVYATAINALTLEVYYRYANVFGGTR